MMRANAWEGGREGFRGRATEGVWSLMGLVVEPAFRESRLLKKNCLGGPMINGVSSQGRPGESSDPMIMKATAAIPALMTRDRLLS